MENYSYSSYPDSSNSSPRSREIDCDNDSWEEPHSSNTSTTNYTVKFMCSYGGKIHPRHQDNQLAYVGGDTKILAVDRSIRFSAFVSKLYSISDSEVCFKYQLPGEDLDSLISVTNDEDLEHMMLEYDRMFRASAKPARLRLFLFPLNSAPPSTFGSTETNSERQWFVDALNSAQVQTLENSSPPAPAVAAANPDFLFGLDKGHTPPSDLAKIQHPSPVQTVPEAFPQEIRVGSDFGSEGRHVIGDPVMSPSEIQRQIQQLQRMQIAGQEQAMFQRRSDESNPNTRVAYYGQRVQDNNVPPPQQPAVPISIQSPYWPERHKTSGGYQVMSAPPGSEQPVYLIPTQGGVYQAPAMRPAMTERVGQAYYGMQRMGSEVYREKAVYSALQQQPIQLQQQQRIGGAYTDASGMMRLPMGPGIGVTEHRYAQVNQDGAGRHMYYTAQGGVGPPYQAVTAADVRQSSGALSQEGGAKVVFANAPPQTSTL